LHIGWGLCDGLCLVICRGRYGFGGVVLLSRTGLVGVFGGEEEGGGVRSGPGAARTILLFHIISARPSKQPRMVRTFLKVYMELGSYFLFLQEQIKDIIIFHIISAGPSKQPLMVRNFLKVCGAWLLFFFLQEQTKEIIIMSNFFNHV
jgi:hypothetical protein